MTGGDISNGKADAVLSGGVLAAFPGEAALGAVGSVTAIMAADELGDEVMVDVPHAGDAVLVLQGGAELSIDAAGEFRLNGELPGAEESAVLFSAFVSDESGAESVVTYHAEGDTLWAEIVPAEAPTEIREAVLDIDATVDILEAIGEQSGELEEVSAIFEELGLHLTSDTPVYVEQTEAGVLLSIENGSAETPSFLLPDWDLDDLSRLIDHRGDDGLG